MVSPASGPRQLRLAGRKKKRNSRSSFTQSKYLLALPLLLWYVLSLFSSSSSLSSSSSPFLPQRERSIVSRSSSYDDEISLYYQEDAANERCAEALYFEWNPDTVNRATAEQQYGSGKEHYLQQGYQSADTHYFCPQQCLQQTDPASCICDREAAYLRSNPDVAQAVKDGQFQSGWDHYQKFPQGRPYYSCYERNLGGGIGDQKDCKTVFHTFMNATRAVVSTWPVTGNDPMVLEPDSCRAVVIVEGRNDHPELMDYVVRNHRRYTGPDWMFYLIGPPPVADQWRKLYTGPGITIVDLPEIYGDLSIYPDQIDAVYRSEFLWEHVVQCESVLVSQTDALLLRHGIENEYMQLHHPYAYVGSPVYPESFPTVDWRRLCVQTVNCGGNGGLSVRRRSSMLAALHNCSVAIDEYNEDVWYSYCMVEQQQRMPHPSVANRFSTGSTCHVDSPIGVHKLWLNCQASVCVQALVTSQLYVELYGGTSNINAGPKSCREGELYYLQTYEDARNAVESGEAGSAWDHYVQHSDRQYPCFHDLAPPSID